MEPATNFIDDLLQQAQSKESESLKFVEVEKALDLQYDLGNLTVTDPNELDMKAMRGDVNGYLLNLARDNVQLFIKQMWDLPTSKVDETIVAKLPAPTTLIPRAKPQPKP